MNGILFADLSSICKNHDLLSDVSRIGYWQTVEYETKETRGVLLSAKQDNFPPPLILTPGLTGWYRIYVGVVACINQAENNTVSLRLTSDESYTQFKPFSDIEGSGIEENYWKCADMTGQELELVKFAGGRLSEECMLGWLRFEPMTEKEIAEFEADEKDTSHKNIYATNDMHCLAYFYSAKEQKEWGVAVQQYEQSDVEWLSIESVYMNDGVTPVPVDEFSFNRAGDKNVQKTFPFFYNDEMLKKLVQHGHDLGLKMCVSQRMGEWCLPFPYEDTYFDNQFWKMHPEYWCVDRDGAVIPALSYIYPEFRSYLIGILLRQAANGFDAVELMFHRGIPYVLFEDAFCQQFEAKYGTDPRVLPWKDERIMQLRSDILTGFVQELREALDNAGCEKTRIHLRGLHSIYDNRLLGIDPERLAEEKLVDAFIVHPLICREMLECNDVWQDADRSKVDLAKYTRCANEGDRSIIWRHSDFAYAGSVQHMFDRLSEKRLTEAERIAEWNALERKYGVQIYFEVLPRSMSAHEYKDRLEEIYNAGGKRFSFWDTYGRAPRRYTWNLIRKAGHREYIHYANYGPDGCSTRHRFLKTGKLFTGRFRPNWGS